MCGLFARKSSKPPAYPPSMHSGRRNTASATHMLQQRAEAARSRSTTKTSAPNSPVYGHGPEDIPLAFRPGSERVVQVQQNVDGHASSKGVPSVMTSPTRVDLIGGEWVERFGEVVGLPACTNGCYLVKYGDGFPEEGGAGGEGGVGEAK